MILVFEGSSFCGVHGQQQNALGIVKKFLKGTRKILDMKCDFWSHIRYHQKERT
jgi:hypothetical protein